MSTVGDSDVGLRLQLELGRSGVPLTFFVRTVTDLLEVLRILERNLLGVGHQASWEVNANDIQIKASANGVSGSDLREIVANAYTGIKAISEGEAEALPPALTHDARTTIKRIVNRVQQTGPAQLEADGHASVEIRPMLRATPSPIPRRPTPKRDYKSLGLVDGELDIISVKSKPYFVIFEHVIGNRVRCSFQDNFFDQAKDCLGQRVRAEGIVSYKANGEAVALDSITALEVVPPPSAADIFAVRGAWADLAPDVSSYEYVRQLREDEDG